MMDRENSFTKDGNMRAPPLHVLCDFELKYSKGVRVETVIKSFKDMASQNSMNEDELLGIEEEDDSEDSSHIFQRCKSICKS